MAMHLIYDALFKKRYIYLFICLLLPYLLHPWVQTAVAGISILDIAFTLVLFVAMFAMSDHRRLAIPVLAIVLVVLASTWMARLFPGLSMYLVTLFLNAAFMLYVVGYLLKHILRRHTVTVNTIFASLCVYLLLGYTWAFAYCMVEIDTPGSFYISEKYFQFQMARDHVFNQLYYFMYFSFTTLTSLGLGDILPASPAARVLTALESIFGQIYVVVLVSRLVTLHINNASLNAKRG